MTQRRSATSDRIERSAPHEGLRARYEAPEASQCTFRGVNARGRSPGGCAACRRPSGAAGAGRDSRHWPGPGGACECWRASASAPVADARSRRDGRWVARDVRRVGATAAGRGAAGFAVGWHTRRPGRRACGASVFGRGPAPTRSCAAPARGKRDHRLVAVVPLVRDHLDHASTGRQHRFDLLRRRDQRLDDRRPVAGAGILHGDADDRGIAAVCTSGHRKGPPAQSSRPQPWRIAPLATCIGRRMGSEQGD